MNRLFVRTAALVAIPLLASGLLTSCGKDPTPPSPPTDVAIVAGDQGMTVTWTMAPDVQYWLYYAPRTSISTSDWMGTDSKVLLNVTSPTVISGLTNGQIYSVTIDGRYNGGRAGSGSASVSATPQLAGATWTAGTSTGSDLRGIAYGATFVAAGLGGAMYSSADGKTWTALVSNTTSDLNAAVYGGIYVAAGAGGTVVTSSDAVTWTATTTGNAINALATNGAGFYVAVGAAGGTQYSSGGVTWSAVANGAIASPLYGATYGVVAGVTGLYVAVGGNGTIFTSTDGVNWTAQASPTASTLAGVAWGADPTGVTRFVAVGAAGTVITSTDGVTWTAATTPPPATTTLNAVTYGHQFIAVGNGGAIYASTDGLTWQSPTTNPATANLYAIAHNTTFPYGYAAVGAAGANLTAY